MENIFSRVHGWKAQMDEKFGWKLNIKNFLDDNYKLTNNLDETFDNLKCMDGINFKTIMMDENHIYMDESYKRMKY